MAIFIIILYFVSLFYLALLSSEVNEFLTLLTLLKVNLGHF